MRTLISRWICALVFLELLTTLAACSPGSVSGTGAGAPESGPTASGSPGAGEAGGIAAATPRPTAEPTHLCDHPYFPAVDGASWTYSSADSAAGPYSFTDSITSVRADGFTLRGDFDGLVRTQEWSCSAAGLALLDYSGMGAAQVMTEGLQVQFETTEMNGITLPADLEPGDEWSQSFSVAGTATLQTGLESSVQGTASAAHRALGFETVTVAAGTFEALRVERTIALDLTVQFGEAGMPIQIDSEEIIWFVAGVGWVKDSFTGTVETTPVNESIELTSYSIP
jgi:hypothetical protein